MDLYLFLLILTGLNGIRVSATTSKSSFRIYKLDNDCLDADLPMKLTDVTINLENDTYFLRFNVDIKIDLPEDLKLEFLITRCFDKSSPDTCEDFHRLTFPRFCAIVKIRGPWIAYLENMKPPLQCPYKKGKYILDRSVSCKLKELERLRFGRDFFFKVSMKQFGMKTNKLYFCGVAEGQT